MKKELMITISVTVLALALYALAGYLGFFVFIETLKIGALMAAFVSFMVANVVMENIALPMWNGLDNLDKNMEA